MGVEFIPKNKDCFTFGLPNATWFKILDNKKIKDILKCDKTNDPIDVSSDDTRKLLNVVNKIDIPGVICGDIKRKIKEKPIKELIVEFLKCCGGFTTR